MTISELISTSNLLCKSDCHSKKRALETAATELGQQFASLVATLEKPIDFDAIDGKPVDVMFVLVVPDGEEQQHLDTLAAIVECFSNSELLNQLRGANSTEELKKLLVNR